jgi:cell fate (sporulation/competence/biofilm development) regulator YlbF (YheA/YmcA/DUF963 family)
MEDLNTKIKELSEEILKTKEFRNYEKALTEFQKDKDSKKLFTDFQQAQQKLSILQQGDFPEKEKQREKTEELLNQVKKNEKITNWLQKQRELEILTGEIAKTISKNINFPLTLPQKCGGCSC